MGKIFAEIKKKFDSDEITVFEKVAFVTIFFAMVSSFCMTILVFALKESKIVQYLMIFEVIFVNSLFWGVAFRNIKSRVPIRVLTLGIWVVMPIIWIYTGGFDGGANFWLLFDIIFVMIVYNGRELVCFLMLSLISSFGTVAYASRHKEIIPKVDTTMANINECINIVWLLIYLFMVVEIQKVLFKRERDKIAQSDLQKNAMNQELTAANIELQESSRLLEETLENQKNFVNAVNHELRTPLNGIIGNLEILLADNTIEPVLYRDLLAINQSADDLLVLVNDMLDCAKLDSGKLDIYPEDFDLKRVTDSLYNSYRGMAEKKHLDFSVMVEPGTVCGIYSDPHRITQIVSNIISNAIKYTSRGFVKVLVDVKGKNLIFDVIDSGQGISEKGKEILFEPYTRLNEKQNADIQGTGLGLSIVGSLVERMGGTITVESELGAGSDFRISIPVRVTRPNLFYSTPRANNVAKQKKHTDFKDVRVLYADDTPTNLLIFKRILNSLGCSDVDVVDNGFDLLNKVGENEYDIIFVDHMMPKMDGIQTIRKFHSIEHMNSGVPVVLFSGVSKESVKKQMEETGIDGFLSKPVKRQDIVDIFHEFVV